jgi:quinol monooxygenase YgiN
MFVVISGTWDVHPSDRENFLNVIEAVTAPSRAEPGCVDYWFSASLEDPNRFHMYERWQDQAALEEHWKTPHLLKFREDVDKLNLTREIARHKAEEFKT